MVSSCVDFSNVNHCVSSIYTENGSFIRKVISCLTDENEAEDVYQSFYLHLLANPLINDADNIEAYIYKSIVNFTKNFVRQKTCYRANLNEYAKTVGVVETEKSPEKDITDAEETAKFFALIRKQLSNKEFTAISLYFREGHTVEQIATIMDIKVTAVHRYMSRAYDRIRNSCSAELFAAL